MGSVWEGIELPTDRRVAIKALHDHLTGETDLAHRFEREAKAALESRYSGHIIELIDVVQPPGKAPYQIMEYLEGEDLAKILDREGSFEAARAAELVIQACHAVAEVHRQGIIHRDVKPENLFVTYLQNGAEWIKLLDFGVAKFRISPDSDERPLTEAGSTLGTPYYMAPEQVLVSETLDHRLDIYAMGVVLYELLSGRRPYESGDIRDLMISIARGKYPPLSKLRPDLDPGLVAVVKCAMSKHKDERYESMFDLAEALEPFAHPGGTPQRQMDSYNTVIERAGPSIESEPPTSPGLPAVIVETEDDDRRSEAPTEISLPQIDLSEIDPAIRGNPHRSDDLSSLRGRSSIVIFVGLVLGLTAAVIAFIVVLAIFRRDPQPAEAPDSTVRPASIQETLPPHPDAAFIPALAPLGGVAMVLTGDGGPRPEAGPIDGGTSGADDVDSDLTSDARPFRDGDVEHASHAPDTGSWSMEQGLKTRPRVRSRTPPPPTGPLTQAEIARGLQTLQPKIHKCLRSDAPHGKAFQVVVKIHPSGSVAFLSSTLSINQASTACLRRAASGKLFRPSPKALVERHAYPFP
jgi:serine/threonine protein kinase